MATQPQFASGIRLERGALTTANAARDGTGTIVDVFTANTASGAYVKDIVVAAEGITTAGIVRVFTKQSGAYKLLAEISVTAVAAPSDTVKCFTSTLNLNQSIPNGTSIALSTAKSENFSVTIYGANY